MERIVPISEYRCQECGWKKSECHNSFKFFPPETCTHDFYEQVSDVLFSFKDKFTLEQFHEKLMKEVYLNFKEIKEPILLSAELLIDVHRDDLGVVDDVEIGLFRVV